MFSKEIILTIASLSHSFLLAVF